MTSSLNSSVSEPRNDTRRTSFFQIPSNTSFAILYRCTPTAKIVAIIVVFTEKSSIVCDLEFDVNYFYEMKSNAPYDYLIKIILVGDTCVGKTSFLLRFTEQLFDDASHIATIGKSRSIANPSNS